MLQAVRSLCFAAAAVFATIATVAYVAPCARPPQPAILERFDPALSTIRSVKAAEEHIRAKLPPQATPAQIATAVEDFAAQRFLHGYSSFSICDNWVAYVAGGLWFDLRVPIDADDVLKHEVAICTQNTTVVQALLERFGIRTASAIFRTNKHIAPLAMIDGRWALYDGDLEPRHEGVVYLDEFPKVAMQMYTQRTSQLYGEDFATIFQQAADHGEVRVAPPTRASSTRGRIFQQLSWFMSWFGWAVFLVLGWVAGRIAAHGAGVRGTQAAEGLDRGEDMPIPERP